MEKLNNHFKKLNLDNMITNYITNKYETVWKLVLNENDIRYLTYNNYYNNWRIEGDNIKISDNKIKHDEFYIDVRYIRDIYSSNNLDDLLDYFTKKI